MPLSRRAFLDWLGRGTALGVAALSGRFLWSFFAHGHERGSRSRSYLGRSTEVLARVQSSREGYWLDAANQVLILQAADTGADGLVAVSLACTHLGCALRPSQDQSSLVCPCHGSRFAFLDGQGGTGELGRVQQGPATRDLERYSLVRVGERLFLEGS